MRTAVDSETFDIPGYAIDDTSQYTGKEGLTYIDAATAWDKDGERLTVFAINRSEEEEYPLTIDISGFDGYGFERHVEFACTDMEARNSFENPEVLAPVENADGVYTDGMLKAHVKPLSWNVFCFRKND